MEELVIGKGDALVIVDGENDFIRSDGALYVAGVPGEAENEVIIPRIRSLGHYDAFGWRATTEDEHPKGHIEFVMFGPQPHCVKGTPGQKYHPSLEGVYAAADENLKKGQNKDLVSLSVDMSRQWPVHVANLRRRGIKRVFLVGWAYTHCVGKSALSYIGQGFETCVIRDCTRSVAPPYGDPKWMDDVLQLNGVKQVLFGDIA